jgi:orotate phosphoribosyltransferase
MRFNIKSPFLYASGLRGPIYCDNRILFANPNERNAIVEHFLNFIAEHDLVFDYVAGMATAAIPWATLIADRLGKPLLYVRSKAKEHGTKKLVEGFFEKGSSALLIEDLVNQGSSLSAGVLQAREEGLVIGQSLSIVDYEMAKARQAFKNISLQHFSLTNFSLVLKEAQEQSLLTLGEVEEAKRWQQDPEQWSKN